MTNLVESVFTKKLRITFLVKIFVNVSGRRPLLVIVDDAILFAIERK